MNDQESHLPSSEPTEAGTFPPMRSSGSAKIGVQPESTVDYRNHNLVAALFFNREQAVEAVQALRQFSQYTPAAIGLSSRLRTPAGRNAEKNVVVVGILGGLFGGLSVLSQRPQPSTLSVLIGVGIGAVVGGFAGALLNLTVARQERTSAGGSGRKKSVLVKVRARDLGETATILREHHGSLRSGTGAPFPSVHPE